MEDEFYTLSDVFCVNETEVRKNVLIIEHVHLIETCNDFAGQAEIITGIAVTTSEEAAAAARQLITMKGCKNHVLITLGSKGALLLSRDNVSKPELIDSPKVEAVDTTVCLICILCVLYCVYSFHQKLKNSDKHGFLS